MENKKKLNHIVLLRAFTITLVVLGHATRSSDSPAMYLYNPTYTPFFEVVLLKYIYSFHMPLFFWISGYIFYYSIAEKTSFRPIWELLKKIKRLIIPLYATAFLVLLPTIFFFGHPDGSLLHMCKKFILGKDIVHLWFLKSLFYIFIVVIPTCSILKKMTPLQSIFICLVLLFLSASGIIFPRFLRDLLFFLLGYFTCKYSTTFLKPNPFYPFVFLFLSHLSLFIATQLNFIPTNYKIYLWYLTPILGIYFMYYLTDYLSKKAFLMSFWNPVSMLDRTSYSIYLFHPTLIYIVLFMFSFVPSSYAFLRIIVSFLLGLTVPIGIYRLFSHIRLGSSLFSIPYSIKSA